METKANNSKPVMICPMVYEMSGEEWHLSHQSELHAESIGEFRSKQEASAALAFMVFCLEHREGIEDVARELIYLCDLERMDGDYTDDDEPSDLRKQQIETANAIIAHSESVDPCIEAQSPVGERVPEIETRYNPDRSQVGRELVNWFMENHMDENDQDMQSAISDMLADLRHFCAEDRIDFDKMLSTSECHYTDETETDADEEDEGPADEKTYYAVCHAGGPISRNLGCVTFETALAMISANGREWIDASTTDAESDLDFKGEGMDEQDFFDALTAAGLECVHESGVAGDWSIWLRH